MSSTQQTVQYHDIILTDIQLHAQKPCNPPSLYRQVVKSIRNKNPGRAYTTNISGDTPYTLNFVFNSPDIQEQIAAAKRAGKQIRFQMPPGGLPVYAGKDLIEFIKSHKKKYDHKI